MLKSDRTKPKIIILTIQERKLIPDPHISDVIRNCKAGPVLQSDEYEI